MQKISFVIPCYKSELTIENVVDEIISKMQTEGQKYCYEIILVNDNSPDNTFGVIRKLCNENDNIIGVDQAKNMGQHAALMAGFQFISGDIVVCLDDDGQTPADEVDKLLNKLDEGYDVVYANYDNKQHSSFRNFGSKVNGKMLEVMLDKPKEIYLSSYFAARRFIIDEIIRYKHSYPYMMGLVLRTTKNICNVNVNHRSREVGESGYSLKKLLTLWFDGFTAFSVLPLRLATIGGVLISLIGFVMTIYVVIRRLVDPTRVLGWSSLAAINLILGGVILLVLGMIGEYIGRIYMCINSSPQYVIKSVINYSKKSEL